MNQPFTNRLLVVGTPIWESQYVHPFILGIGSGFLDLEKFKFWVRQDYLFLVEYSKVFAFAAGRVDDLSVTKRLLGLAQSTLETELDLHVSYAREFGIDVSELEHEEKSPVCQAYTDFLIRTSLTGSFGEIASALLPCMWGFSEIGKRLEADGLPRDERYARWIQMYTGEAFLSLADWCRELVDEAAKGQPQIELDRMEKAFLISSRYELMFWEMAWNQENWPV